MRFMALESRTSPPLEASTTAAIADHSSSDFMLLLAARHTCFPRLRRSKGRPARDPAHAAAYQQNAQPACWRDVLMKKGPSQDSYQDVTHGRGGQNVTEISPGKRGQVGRKESHQAGDPNQHPGIGECGYHMQRMMEIDRSKVIHASF